MFKSLASTPVSLRFLPSSSSLRTFSTASARLSSSFSSVPLTPRIARNTPSIPLTTQQLSHFPSRKYSTMADHGNVISITSDAEFKEKVLDSKDPIVVDCFATWCGPCKAIAPKVAEFSQKYPQAKFYQIDVDQLSSTAADLGVRAMPSFLLFKNGERLDQDVVGANPGALENAVKSLIA